MPTFKLFRKSKLVDEVVGANPNEIRNKLQKHNSGASSTAAFSGQGHVLGNGSEPKSSPILPPRPNTSTTFSPPIASESPSSSPYIWLLFLFIVVYWWLGNSKSNDLSMDI
ncbi:hypothetical protein HMI54_004081 [Coelomomyces lativittatus]|nr:hypothetical protein HMI54_004081 [Coelomomyces lativittatus]KAJ1507600.1 hypothetical protein HMI56_007706 [Coelomomyces lativittatus]